MRMSKVNLDPGAGGNSFVMSHFRSLIEGHGTEPLAVNEAHYVAKALLLVSFTRTVNKVVRSTSVPT